METQTLFDLPEDNTDDTLGSQKYLEFLKKFETKKTTDDCYTPTEVYEAVKAWVLKECPQIRGLKIVRPFYPGGDYEHEDYTRKVVIDNPPFSIMVRIKRFYISKGVPFFLFAPGLVLFNYEAPGVCFIISGVPIVYDNGAKVRTDFISNLFGSTKIILAPDLSQAIKDANRKKNNLNPKYEYPPNVITGATLGKFVSRGLDIRIDASETFKVAKLDAQTGKDGKIFGNGFLVSDRIAKIFPEALKKAPLASTTYYSEKKVFELSEREKKIVEELNKNSKLLEH